MSASPARPQRPMLAVVLMLSATLCFALLDVTAKHLAKTFSVTMLAWARYATHLLIMIVVFGPALRSGLVRTRRPVALSLRGLILAVTTICFMAALQIMPLAESTAIAFTAPLLVALASGPILGERVGLGRWLAIFTGFIGIMLIAHVGVSNTRIPLLGIVYALAAALCLAVYQLHTRLLSSTETTITMLFYTALWGTIALSCVLPWVWQETRINWEQGLLIVLMGLTGGGGHLLLTHAFRHATASAISPLSYVQLVWATLLGWLVFDYLPDLRSSLGIAFVASAGVLVVVTERASASVTKPSRPDKQC